MGADLVLAYIVVKKGTDLKKSKTAMLNAVKRLGEKDINSFDGYYEQAYGDVPPDDIKKIKKDVIEVIKDVFTAITELYRDVTFINHKGETIYISGGMSWGDNPTESYTSFAKFNDLPDKLLKAGGFS